MQESTSDSPAAGEEPAAATSARRRAAAVGRLVQLGWEPAHSAHVCALALQLFDSLVPLHGLDGTDRDILEVAALLHDVGWTIGEKKHHKHTLQLIRAVPLDGFTPVEQLVTANVARYHRRSLPRPSHRQFAALSVENQLRVRRLAALLRVADGLDRRHLQVVRELRAEATGRTVVIRLWVGGDARREILAASLKSDLFRHAFGVELRFTTVHGPDTAHDRPDLAASHAEGECGGSAANP